MYPIVIIPFIKTYYESGLGSGEAEILSFDKADQGHATWLC